MATLTMRYTTQKKYDQLSDADKNLPGYIYYVRNSDNYGGDYNAYWTLGKCYGAMPAEGDPTGMVQINNLASLPAIGKSNTLYAYVNEDTEELTLYMWDKFKLTYHKLEEQYDVIDGGDATSKMNVIYNKQ